MSKKITWCADFNVGHDVLNQQHMRLALLNNELADAVEMKGRDGDVYFHEILNEISELARAHFSLEETLLARYGYPDLEQHKEMHFEFQCRLIDIVSTATFGSVDKHALQRFLGEWWNDHILTEDRKYADFLQRAMQR